MSEKWDKKRMKDTMEASKEEFFELTKRLHELMVDFGVRALKTFEASKGEPLNPLQARQVIVHEIESVCKQILKPEYIELAVEKAETKYWEWRQ